MLRHFSSLFSANRRNPSASRAAVAAKRPRTFRPGLEDLETRLVPSSVPLHVAGNQLEDSANNPVVLRGVNIISLEWRPDGDNVMQAVNIAINAWHATLLRLPVNQDFWFGHDEAWTGGESGDGGAAYRALVDQVISTAQADNVYVMLDLHWSDMGVPGANNGQHYMPDDLSNTFWQDAAPRYANNPAVLFDPYNEPHIGDTDQPSDADFALWRNGGWVFENSDGFNGTYHSPGMQGLINTIRAAGANNIVAPEGLNWGSDLAGVFGSADGRIGDHHLSDPTGNLMYQTHLYPNKLAIDEVASSVETVANNYPIYVGEWGAGGVVGQPDDGAAASNQQMISYLDNHPNFSWTAWALTPDLGGEYNLLTAWDGAATTSDYGAYVKASLLAHANGGGLSATAAFQDVDDWGSGFTGYITLTNTGNTAINGWTLQFDFTGNITDIWDAQIVSHVGNHYVIQNADWDATIAPGQSVDFGFNADWGNPQTGPSNYVLNGVSIPGL
jgi:hypothetical protein